MSLADHGLTFGTNSSAGVCVHFREPVPSPLRRKGHPALTVTVADTNANRDTDALEHSEPVSDAHAHTVSHTHCHALSDTFAHAATHRERGRLRQQRFA